MNRNKQQGFVLVEGALLIAIAAIIGFTGWYVLRSKNNANSNYNNAVSASDKVALQSAKAKVLPKTPTKTTTTNPTTTTNNTQQAVPVANPGAGDFDDGMTLQGTISGTTASVHWQWGKHINPANGFILYYSTSGPSAYSNAPTFSEAANSYKNTFNLPAGYTYYMSICPKDKPANDNSCSNTLVLTAK